MAAEWYYLVNQQQAGPVELQAMQQMIYAGSLTSADLIFGPGLSQWTPVAQVPAFQAIFAGAAQAPQHQYQDPRAAGGAGMLSYSSAVDTGATGISHRAMDMLRQTKPWARLIAVMMFIGAGLMIVSGLLMMVGGAMMGSRVSSSAAGLPAAMGFVYLLMGALYLAPAVFLNRYASGIADVLRTRRTRELEEALEAQKSFWKFAGIMTLVIICIYAVVLIIVAVTAASRF